jgi:V-type H+-transporting ATPase subunit H
LENKCQQADDPEMQDNVQAIANKLANNYRELNTFERYQQELFTGELEWGTIHTEKFWKENVRKFEADDFGCVRKLIALLTSKATVTAAVACNDVGYFVQLYPNGKAIVERMGGKQAVMSLLTHDDADVQKQALLCCSKLMVTKWEFLGM